SRKASDLSFVLQILVSDMESETLVCFWSPETPIHRHIYSLFAGKLNQERTKRNGWCLYRDSPASPRSKADTGVYTIARS
ncbi:hypothetical protein U0070_003728, partial [Myodes glareolus]